MKSFSQKTKEAICKLPLNKSCCIAAEMIGILIFAGRIKENSVRVSSESSVIVKRLAVLVKRFCGEGITVEETGNSFFCTIANKNVIDLFLDYEKGNTVNIEAFTNEDCCKGSFLRGAFLGGGILVDPKKNYNLEFIATEERTKNTLETVMANMQLDFKTTKRKNSYVLYSKNSDTVCDALTYMGAVGAQMQILNLKIERELRNDLNRVNNGELANMDKVLDAAARQAKAIQKIEDTIGIEKLPDDLREVALMRKSNMDLSLDALGKRLNPPLTKSGVNHRLKRIMEMADKL